MVIIKAKISLISSKIIRRKVLRNLSLIKIRRKRAPKRQRILKRPLKRALRRNLRLIKLRFSWATITFSLEG